MKIEVDKFYSWSSTLTVAGMASMLWVVLGTVSSAFSWRYPGWFPLVLAFVFVIVGDLSQRASETPATHGVRGVLARVPLWLVNSCLVYTTALGGAHAVQPKPDDKLIVNAAPTGGVSNEVAPSSPKAPAGAQELPVAPEPESTSNAATSGTEVPTGHPSNKVLIEPAHNKALAGRPAISISRPRVGPREPDQPPATTTTLPATLELKRRPAARTGFKRLGDTALLQ